MGVKQQRAARNTRAVGSNTLAAGNRPAGCRTRAAERKLVLRKRRWNDRMGGRRARRTDGGRRRESDRTSRRLRRWIGPHAQDRRLRHKREQVPSPRVRTSSWRSLLGLTACILDPSQHHGHSKSGEQTRRPLADDGEEFAAAAEPLHGPCRSSPSSAPACRAIPRATDPCPSAAGA